jgi:hypothetical protein
MKFILYPLLLCLLHACQGKLNQQTDLPTLSKDQITAYDSQPKPAVDDSLRLDSLNLDTSAQKAQRPSSRVAKLSFEKREIDLGRIGADSNHYFRFHFTNLGNKPLEILKTESSCPCLKTKFPDYLLAEKESAALDIELRPKGKKGKQEFQIKVFSNADSSEILLKIRCTPF